MNFKDTVKSLLTSAKSAVQRLLAFVPTPLPIGVAAHEKWVTSILSMYGYPDNDSTRFAVATMVLNLGPTSAYKAKRYFGLAIHAGAAKQIAGHFYVELKEKQKAEEAARKKAEATALTAAASDVQPIQN